MPDKKIKMPFDAVDDVPVGTIIAWGGSYDLIPSGWLLCDGESIYASQFPDLCAIIQDYWGPINAVSGQHILPDLRAMFLRGVNGPRNDLYSDPQYLSRTSINNRPNEVGSFEQDAFQSHRHEISFSHNPSFGSAPNNTGGGDERLSFQNVESITVKNPISDTTPGNIVRTSVETRPKNAYVYYLIKAGTAIAPKQNI